MNLVSLNKIKKKLIEHNYDDIIYLDYANDGRHKYMVITSDGKKIKFGNINYEDYLIHKDKKRRDNFRNRNKRFLNYDKYSPAQLSYNILW
jgi:hypothetical protein